MFEEKLKTIGDALMACSGNFFDVGFPVTHRKGQYIAFEDKKIGFEDIAGNYFFIESAKGNRINHISYKNPKQTFAEKIFTLYAIAPQNSSKLIRTEKMYQCILFCLNEFGFLKVLSGFDDTENAVSDFMRTIKEENKSAVFSKLMTLSIIRIDFSIVTDLGNDCGCKIC